MTYQELLDKLRAEGIGHPEFNLRADCKPWVTVRDGKIVGVDFDPTTFELDPYPGIAFAREAGTANDGADLTPEEQHMIWQTICNGGLTSEAAFPSSESIDIEKIEDSNGTVYYDRS